MRFEADIEDIENVVDLAIDGNTWLCLEVDVRLIVDDLDVDCKDVDDSD